MLGEPTPYGIQQFLYRGAWEADALRDDLCQYVVEQLGDARPEGTRVLIVDETGFVKKGSGCPLGAAGVQRHRGSHRELPDRRLSGLCCAAGHSLD